MLVLPFDVVFGNSPPPVSKNHRFPILSQLIHNIIFCSEPAFQNSSFPLLTKVGFPEENPQGFFLTQLGSPLHPDVVAAKAEFHPVPGLPSHPVSIHSRVLLHRFSYLVEITG